MACGFMSCAKSRNLCCQKMLFAVLLQGDKLRVIDGCIKDFGVNQARTAVDCIMLSDIDLL